MADVVVVEQAALGASNALPHETRTLIEKFLAVSGDPDDAAAELRALTAAAGIELGAALDLFESRTGFLAARGVDVGKITFSTAFGRGLDYYTGFVFELHDPASPPNGPLVAGGRYDEARPARPKRARQSGDRFRIVLQLCLQQGRCLAGFGLHQRRQGRNLSRALRSEPPAVASAASADFGEVAPSRSRTATLSRPSARVRAASASAS